MKFSPSANEEKRATMSSTATRISSTPEIAKRRLGKYLVFRLNKEEFGVHVLKVREIMGVQDITHVPHAPKYMKGVINLRGKIIPVIDLRSRLGLAEAEHTSRTCIVVLQVANHGETMQAGMVVDGVSEVLNIAENDIEEVPVFGATVDTSCLLGIANIKGQVKLLLDVDMALAGSEIYGSHPAEA
jgi:purine-binding chemotaxis protein CheW